MEVRHHLPFDSLARRAFEILLLVELVYLAGSLAGLAWYDTFVMCWCASIVSIQLLPMGMVWSWQGLAEFLIYEPHYRIICTTGSSK